MRGWYPNQPIVAVYSMKPVAKINRFEGMPAAAQALAREATTALSRNAFAQAERAITLSLAYAPDHAEPKRLLGMFLHATGRAREALVPLNEALAINPDDADVLIPLAAAHVDAGEFEKAVDTMRRAAELRPDANTTYLYGRMLEQNALMDEAVDTMHRALELDAKHALARLQYARDLFYTGHTDDAVAQFRRLIRDGNELAASWYGLAEMKTVTFDAQDLLALKSLRKRPQFAGLERATLLHAIAKAFEDNGDYPAAFDAYAEAGRLERAAFPCDNAHFAAYIDSVRAAFPQTVDLSSQFGSEAIFIVGMPRSGSTLIEQILASHSRVEGASELPDLTLSLDRESERRGSFFPAWATKETSDDWRRVGADYLDATARWRTQKPRFTDKSPGNWMQAEAAIAMLPGARIINVRRDPVETCWSCFKQFFAPGRMVWGSSLDDIAYFWERCTIHCDYLAARYPRNFRIQSYEKMVDDPEEQSRELLEFCGLPFEDGVLRFHVAARTVRTASAAQVRQPMARGANASDRYGALLDSLRDKIMAAQVRVDQARNRI